jgi:sugar phosphate isomerase/epimerase
MSITRRGFLMAGAATAGATVVPAFSSAQEPKAKPEVVQKLSSQLWIIPGRDLSERLATMEKWGFDAVELPGADNPGAGLPSILGNEKKYEDALKNTKLKVSAICGGKGTGDADVVSDVVSKRAGGIQSLKDLLTSAGALGSTGVIYVPAFNGGTKLGNEEIRKILVDTLPAIGEHAHKAGTRLILEPLNRRESFFLRQVADGASIVRDCKSPGLAVMGDLYHMYYEETSDLGAYISGGPYVHHVHMASAHDRVLPGQDERQYVDGFRGLKWIGYQDYCSLECGVRGDPTVEIPKSVAWLRDQWAKS